MKTYNPRDFCRSINCNALIRTEPQREQLCKDCKAYQMHNFLIGAGLILSEGSELYEKIGRLEMELADMITEKERCRNLAVDWSLKADGYKASLEMCQNMKLAHEFEDLLQTTSIPVAVEKVKGLMALKKSVEALIKTVGKDATTKFKAWRNMEDALAQAKEE